MAGNVDATDIELTESEPALEVAEAHNAAAGNPKIATDDEDKTEPEDSAAPPAAQLRRPGLRAALAGGMVALLIVTGLGLWFGNRLHQAHEDQRQSNLFLEVGRQGALNLTTISSDHVDADIQRVLDSATGTFYDDFQKRSPALAEFVKKAQTKAQGTVTESGLESIDADSARVLVAVSVKVSNAGAAEQDPRNWRMRIDLRRQGDTIKVANVGFVA